MRARAILRNALKRAIDKVIPPLAWLLISLLAATVRVTLRDPHEVLKRLPAHGVIMAFWHNRLLLMPVLQRRFIKHRTVAALISRSRDGQIISDIVHCFGLKTVRGSSSQSGAFAFRELLRVLIEEGNDVAITPDGPRGPRYTLHPGVLELSHRTGRPIIPVTYHLSHKWEMRSWDRFQVPHPFARCEIVIGEPFVASGSEGAADADRLKRALGE